MKAWVFQLSVLIRREPFKRTDRYGFELFSQQATFLAE